MPLNFRDMIQKAWKYYSIFLIQISGDAIKRKHFLCHLYHETFGIFSHHFHRILPRGPFCDIFCCRKMSWQDGTHSNLLGSPDLWELRSCKKSVKYVGGVFNSSEDVLFHKNNSLSRTEWEGSVRYGNVAMAFLWQWNRCGMVMVLRL